MKKIILLLLLLCTAAANAVTTPTNTSALLQVDNSASSTVTLNAGFTFTAGRSAILALSHYADNNDAVTSVTMGGSAATLIKRTTSGTKNFIEIWFVSSMTGGTANVVIVGGAGGGHYVSAAVTEWASGVLSLDSGTENSASGTSAAPSVSTAIGATTASSITMAAVGPVTGVANNNITGPTGYTVIFTEQDSSTHQAGRGAWKEETSTGTKTATFGMTSGDWIAVIASFTIAGGGGGSTAVPVFTHHYQQMSRP